MNLRFVCRQLGLILWVLSGAILLTAAWSGGQLLRDDTTERYALAALAVAVTAGVLCGSVLWAIGGKSGGASLGRRDALLLVAMSWVVGAALAAVPFWIWGSMTRGADHHDQAYASYVSCYFEAMSGLTTTGATVLSRIDTVPRSLLLWRSLIQWLGGLGILVLFIAVLPLLGVGGKRLFRLEAPGPKQEGVRPRVQHTARILWLIYLTLTGAEVLTLHLLGMDWFESVCHTFTTLATGGFSTRNGSIGEFNSAGIDLAVTVFMLLAGVNFVVYYHLICRKWTTVWGDRELAVYLGLLLAASAVVSVSLVGNDGAIVATTGTETDATVAQSVRHAVFQVVSMQTTTGYCTADFDRWPFVAKAVLLALMFVGASAGSTGGGVKVIRCVIAAKVMIAEIEHVFRPNVVRTVKVGRAVVDPGLKLATLGYLLGIVFLFLLGTVLLKVLERNEPIDITTAATAVAATLNNIGPGLAKVGAVENFGWFSAPSKLVMCLLMALGRLEIFAIVVLFAPQFWRSD